MYNTLKRLSIWHFWETLKKPFLVVPSIFYSYRPTRLQETVILGKNNTSNTQTENLFPFNYLFLCKCLEWWSEWPFRFLEYGRRLRPVTIICISQEVLRKLTNAYLNFDIMKNFDFGMSFLENMIDFLQTKLLRRIYQIFETWFLWRNRLEVVE